MTGNMEDLQHDANQCLQDQDQGGRSSQTTSLQKILWTDESKINFYYRFGKEKYKDKENAWTCTSTDSHQCG